MTLGQKSNRVGPKTEGGSSRNSSRVSLLFNRRFRYRKRLFFQCLASMPPSWETGSSRRDAGCSIVASGRSQRGFQRGVS